MGKTLGFFFLIIISFCDSSYSQNQNNIWYFGMKAGVDFNSGSPVALTNSAMDQSEGTAIISDASGNLLFYTDGVTVWDANHVQMPNGYGLLGNNSSTQSALIVPKSCGTYYLFTVPAEDTIIPLCYSIVDMNSNGGLGDVILKNVPLYHPVNEKLTATLDSSGTGYWVVASKFGTNAIISYHVSQNGIDTIPVITTIPALADTGFISVMPTLGYMKISSAGTKLCYTYTYYNNTSVLLDFDKNTGTVSNPVILQNSSGGYGVEFSPDNSKLYISTINAPFVIWQYDLLAGSPLDIQNSVVVIDSMLYNGGAPQYGGALQLGPDGKVYADRLQKGFIGVINQPNLSGALCNYVDSAVYLNGKYCQDGLPNCIKQYAPMSPSPVPPTITQSNDTLMSSLASGYQWFMNGNIIPGATNQQLIITQTGTYSLEVIDSNGCSASASILVASFPSPGFMASSTSVCEKFCINFFDVSTNNPTGWQWSFPGGDPSSSANQDPGLICYNTPGVFDVTLITTSANGNDTVTLNGFITVNPTPPFPTITENGNVLTSSSSSTYQWQLNSVDITGATNQSYAVMQTGLYTVIAGDLNGCSNSGSRYVLISEVETMNDGSNIFISPNPSGGNFTIELLNEQSAGEVSIDVVNSLGQIVFTSTDKTPSRLFKKEIDLGTMCNGVYLINLKTEQFSLRKKILISR